MSGEQLVAVLVVLGQAGAAVWLGWRYFRRYTIPRPPIGVVTLGDVGIMLAGIVLAPLLYLWLPNWLASGLLGLLLLGVLEGTLEPVVGPMAAWLLAGLAIALNLAAWLQFGPASRPSFAANNLVLVLGTVGVANLWAQSGLKARDAAVLAGALTAYDYLFTSLLPVMANLFGHLEAQSFAPLVGWPVGADGRWLGIGAGDLLIATLVPLVLGRAYGLLAGRVAMAAAFATLAAMLTPGDVTVTFPAMVGLGPVSVLQYLFWSRRGAERTTWEFRQAERATSAKSAARSSSAWSGRCSPA